MFERFLGRGRSELRQWFFRYDWKCVGDKNPARFRIYSKPPNNAKESVPLFLTESSKSPASIAKSNKQWVGTCLYQEWYKPLLISCEAAIRLWASSEADCEYPLDLKAWEEIVRSNIGMQRKRNRDVIWRDNTIYEKVDFPHKYLNWRCMGYDKRTLFDPVLQLNG